MTDYTPTSLKPELLTGAPDASFELRTDAPDASFEFHDEGAYMFTTAAGGRRNDTRSKPGKAASDRENERKRLEAEVEQAAEKLKKEKALQEAKKQRKAARLEKLKELKKKWKAKRASFTPAQRKQYNIEKNQGQPLVRGATDKQPAATAAPAKPRPQKPPPAKKKPWYVLLLKDCIQHEVYKKYVDLLGGPDFKNLSLYRKIERARLATLQQVLLVEYHHDPKGLSEQQSILSLKDGQLKNHLEDPSVQAGDPFTKTEWSVTGDEKGRATLQRKFNELANICHARSTVSFQNQKRYASLNVARAQLNSIAHKGPLDNNDRKLAARVLIALKSQGMTAYLVDRLFHTDSDRPGTVQEAIHDFMYETDLSKLMSMVEIFGKTMAQNTAEKQKISDEMKSVDQPSEFNADAPETIQERPVLTPAVLSEDNTEVEEVLVDADAPVDAEYTPEQVFKKPDTRPMFGGDRKFGVERPMFGGGRRF